MGTAQSQTLNRERPIVMVKHSFKVFFCTPLSLHSNMWCQWIILIISLSNNLCELKLVLLSYSFSWTFSVWAFGIGGNKERVNGAGNQNSSWTICCDTKPMFIVIRGSCLPSLHASICGFSMAINGNTRWPEITTALLVLFSPDSKSTGVSNM